MSGPLFTPDDLPWIVGIGLPLTILLILVTGGTFIILLGVYLALWLCIVHRRPLALYLYMPLAVLSGLDLIPDRLLPGNLSELLACLLLGLWLAAEFVLRSELIETFLQNESYEITISPFWTFCFGSIYLNYCIPPYTPTPRPLPPRYPR